jgi:hypothetical protein
MSSNATTDMTLRNILSIIYRPPYQKHREPTIAIVGPRLLLFSVVSITHLGFSTDGTAAMSLSVITLGLLATLLILDLEIAGVYMSVFKASKISI